MTKGYENQFGRTPLHSVLHTPYNSLVYEVQANYEFRRQEQVLKDLLESLLSYQRDDATESTQVGNYGFCGRHFSGEQVYCLTSSEKRAEEIASHINEFLHERVFSRVRPLNIDYPLAKVATISKLR